MSLANTSFFNTYQFNQGLVYAKTYQQILNPNGPYILMVNDRQSLIASLSTTEVSNAINVINASLVAETTLKNVDVNPISNINQSLNSFFQNNYGNYLRDYFTGLTSSVNVAWYSLFKDSWQQTTSSELVQQVGFATWNGFTTSYMFYPAYSPITNLQSTASITTTIDNTIYLTGFGTDICNFALPGYIISFGTGSLPTPTNYSISTSTVLSIGSTNSLVVSSVGVGNSVFAFRKLKNPEYLEFRFGTSSITGLAATQIFNNFTLNVTLQNNLGLTTASVGITTNNPTGRINIGTYGLPTYLATNILGIAVSGGVVSSPYLQTLEVWVKSVN
jgi:hypothetical protein